MRLVLDTSVLVAGSRSRTGASNRLVASVLRGHLRPLLSVPLALEYEAVLTRPEHLAKSGRSHDAVVNIVRFLCSNCESIHVASRLRPQLVDPDDEFILECAVHGQADAIVTLNRRDFLPAAKRFRIEVLTPGEVVRRLWGDENK